MGCFSLSAISDKIEKTLIRMHVGGVRGGGQGTRQALYRLPTNHLRDQMHRLEPTKIFSQVKFDIFLLLFVISCAIFSPVDPMQGIELNSTAATRSNFTQPIKYLIYCIFGLNATYLGM